MSRGDRSSALPLAWMTAALVLYASLFPFTGWRWPAGSSALALMSLPWPPWLTPVDELLNFVGYVPLGLLGFVVGVRAGSHALAAAARIVVAAALLSYACEVAQHLLPERHPSLKDWLMNTLGAAAGAGLGFVLHQAGVLPAGHRLRQRLFSRDSAGALALLAVWPAALLFPTPLPWGVGQVAPRLAEAAVALLDGVDWANGLRLALAAEATRAPLSALAERVAATCGLLAPILLAYTVSAATLPRLLLAAGALLTGLASMTLATLLNFGPGHATAWMTPAAEVGAIAAAAAALVLLPTPARLVPALALVVLTVLVVLVSQAATDPYFAQSLQAWEQGRWVRFHGLAQWVGWLWPFAAIGWLLARLARRGGPGS